MTQIYGIITDPTGRPLQRHRVTISLRAPGNPFTALGSAIGNQATVDTDQDGRWDLPLIPTDDYEFDGAYYHVDWRRSRWDQDAQWFFTVPAAGGPYNFRDLLITPPVPGVPPPPIPGSSRVVLTDAAVVVTDAAAGETFALDLTAAVGASRTLAAPANPVDGMRRTWRFRQDSVGGRAVVFASGAGGFDPAAMVDPAPDVVTYVTAYFDAVRDRWQVVSVVPGI